jgi:hypothetical protein
MARALSRRVNDFILASSVQLHSHPLVGVALFAVAAHEAVRLQTPSAWSNILPVLTEIDCETIAQVAQDPSSGFHVSALAFLGLAHEFERTDTQRPDTKMMSEHAFEQELDQGLSALYAKRHTLAASHLHRSAAIAHNLKAPESMATAYAFLSLAHHLNKKSLNAHRAMLYWERHHFPWHSRPKGFKRSVRLQRTMYEQLIACIESSPHANRLGRLRMLRNVHTRLMEAYQRLRDVKHTKAIAACIDGIDAEIIMREARDAATPHATTTIPDPTHADIQMHAVDVSDTGPLQTMAGAAVEFLRQQSGRAERRDEALAHWAQAFYDVYPENLPGRLAAPEGRAHIYDQAMAFEMLAYGMMHQTHRPFMNEAIARHHQLLRILQPTIEAARPQETHASSKAHIIMRAAYVLHCANQAYRAYQSAHNADGAHRMATLINHVQQSFEPQFLDAALITYGVLRHDAQNQERLRLARAWTGAYYLLNPADAKARRHLIKDEQHIFDRAIVAEFLGARYRSSRVPTVMLRAQRALETARTGFAKLAMTKRVAHIAGWLDALALGVHDSGIRKRRRPSKTPPAPTLRDGDLGDIRHKMAALLKQMHEDQE